MHKPIIHRPKLCSPNQAIIEQTQRIPRHKRNALTPKRIATYFNAPNKSGVGLLVSGFDVRARLLCVARDATDWPICDVG